VVAIAVLLIVCLGQACVLIRTYGPKGIPAWIKPAFSAAERRKKRERLQEIRAALLHRRNTEEEKQRLAGEKKIAASLHKKVVKKTGKMEKRLRKHGFVEFAYSDNTVEISLPGAGENVQLLYRIETRVDYISRAHYTPTYFYRRYSFRPEERKLLEKFLFFDADQSFGNPDDMLKQLDRELRADIERCIACIDPGRNR